MSFPSPWTASPARLLLVLFLLALPAAAWAVEAAPKDYVEDRAGIIDQPTRQALTARLQELEARTGAQMIVLTVPTTDGVPVRDYSFERAEAWKLGQKGKDNGLLFVVAVNDRKFWFQVGYGLEPVMPDSLAGSIGRAQLVPAFRAKAYGQGIYNAVVAVTDEIAKAQGVALSGEMKPLPRQRRKSSGSMWQGIAFFFLILAFSGIFRKQLSHPDSWGSRRGRYAGGFGTFGGGGFGGFGGGGGGGFGGGGGGGFGGGGAGGGW